MFRVDRTPNQASLFSVGHTFLARVFVSRSGKRRCKRPDVPVILSGSSSQHHNGHRHHFSSGLTFGGTGNIEEWKGLMLLCRRRHHSTRNDCIWGSEIIGGEPKIVIRAPGHAEEVAGVIRCQLMVEASEETHSLRMCKLV